MIDARYEAVRFVEIYYNDVKRPSAHPELTREQAAEDLEWIIEILRRDRGLTMYDYLYAFLIARGLEVRRPVGQVAEDVQSVEWELRNTEKTLKRLRKQKRLLLGELSARVHDRFWRGDTVYRLCKESGFSAARIKKMVGLT